MPRPWLLAPLLIICLSCEDEAHTPPSEEETASTTENPDTDGLDAMDDPLENASDCPASEPDVGDGCDEAALVCKYGSDPECRSRWVCSEDGKWSLDFAMRDCGQGCPEDEPSDGDPCEADRAQCTYGETAQCRSLWLCWEDEWTEVVPARDCDANVFCPESAPETGTACSPAEATPSGELCVYTGGAQCSCGCGWGPPDEEWDEPEAVWFCNVASAELDPSYLRGCPLSPPDEGQDCDTENTCGYRSPDECELRGAGTTVAQCIGGEWTYLESE